MTKTKNWQTCRLQNPGSATLSPHATGNNKRLTSIGRYTGETEAERTILANLCQENYHLTFTQRSGGDSGWMKVREISDQRFACEEAARNSFGQDAEHRKF